MQVHNPIHTKPDVDKGLQLRGAFSTHYKGKAT